MEIRMRRQECLRHSVSHSHHSTAGNRLSLPTSLHLPPYNSASADLQHPRRSGGAEMSSSHPSSASPPPLPFSPLSQPTQHEGGNAIPSGIVEKRRAMFGWEGGGIPSERQQRSQSEHRKSISETAANRRAQPTVSAVSLGEAIDSKTIGVGRGECGNKTSRQMRVDIVGIAISAPEQLLRSGPLHPSSYTSTKITQEVSRSSAGSTWRFLPDGRPDLSQNRGESQERRNVRQVVIRTPPRAAVSLREELAVQPLSQQSARKRSMSPPYRHANLLTSSRDQTFRDRYPPNTVCFDSVPERGSEKKNIHEMKKTCDEMKKKLEEESSNSVQEDFRQLAAERRSLLSRLGLMQSEMAELVRALNSSQSLLEQIKKEIRQPSASSNYGSSLSGDEDNASDSNSQISSLRQQMAIESQSNRNKNLIINRLEKELSAAQECNLSLNAQLGHLANPGSASIKKEIILLRKELKQRASDADQLKKKVASLEKDKLQWERQKRDLEGRLPSDTQTLMAQKRELTMQLDREQSEKHELFLQMNSLIAQLAEHQRETTDMAAADAEKDRLSDSLRKAERAREEAEIRSATLELEKKKLAGDLAELEKELNMKAAALQSLMLAKQEPRIDSDELDRLRVGIDEERRKRRETEEDFEKKREDCHRLEVELAELKRNFGKSELKEKEMEESRQEAESRLARLEGERLKERSTADEGMRGLQSSHTTLQQRVNQLDEELRNKEREIEAMKQEHKKDQEALLRLSQAEDVNKSVLSEIERRMSEAEEVREASEKLVKRLQTEKEENEQRLRRLQGNLEESEKEKKRLAARGDVQEELMTLVTSLKSSRQQNEELQSEVNQLQKELNEAREENEQLQEELRAREEETISLKHTLDDTQRQKSDQTQQLTLLQSAASQSEKREKEEIEEIRMRLEETMAAHAEASKNQQLKEEELAEAHRERESFADAAAKARAETVLLHSEIASLNHRLRDSDSSVKKAGDRLEEVQTRLDLLLEEREKERLQLTEEEKETASRMRDAEDFSRKVKKQLEELEKDHAEREATHTAVHERKIQRLSNEILDYKGKVAESEGRVKLLEEKLRAASEDLSQLQLHLKETIENHGQTLEQTRNEMNEQLKAAEKKSEEAEKKFREAQDTKSVLEQKENIIGASKAKETVLLAEVAALKEELKTLASKYSGDAEELNQRHSDEKEKWMAARQEMENRVADLQGRRLQAQTKPPNSEGDTPIPPARSIRTAKKEGDGEEAPLSLNNEIAKKDRIIAVLRRKVHRQHLQLL